MNISAVLKVVGSLLMFFSLIMVPPALVGVYFNEAQAQAFLKSGIAILFSGFLLWIPFARKNFELKTRDGFLVVVSAWTTLATFGALPFLLSEHGSFSLMDSVFESFSGLTSTGATVLTGIDDLPKSILFYRQFLQWIGGIGLIVLAVAIIPLLGVGGMQLYKAEIPGPVKDTKLTPRITQTAKYLFYIYLGLNIACAGAYWLAGMSLFDAVCHAFSTTSMGGFSTHDASIGYFDSVVIEMIACVFMFLSALNFTLHFTVWKHRNLFYYFRDFEFLFFFSVVLLMILFVCFCLYITEENLSLLQSVRFGIFQTISLLTTTGFASTNYSEWQSFIPFSLLCVGFMGGCAGSTAGGIKVVRVMILYKQFFREMKRLVHPNGVFAIKVGKNVVTDRILQSVWGFIGAYLSVFLFMTIALMMTGLNFETSFSAIAACLNNLGPGLGDVSAHFGDINNTAKLLLCFAMLLGRVEIFTLLVLFTPFFWRK